MMDFKLLQIDTEKDTVHHAFSGSGELLFLSETIFPPPRELYSVSYTGKAARIAPEELWRIFNENFPERFKGRSMSVSDVVEYTLPSNESLYLFADRVGFVPIDFGKEYAYSRMPVYVSKTGNGDECVRFYYTSDKGERTVTVNVSSVMDGYREGSCSEKGAIILTPSEVLQTIFVSEIAKLNETGNYNRKSVYEIFSDIVHI